jgi:hypothetical protein
VLTRGPPAHIISIKCLLLGLEAYMTVWSSKRTVRFFGQKNAGTKQRRVVIILKSLFSGKERRVAIGEDVQWAPEPISARMRVYRLSVLTAVVLKIQVFWVLMPCRLVNSNRRVEASWSLQLRWQAVEEELVTEQVDRRNNPKDVNLMVLFTSYKEDA